MKPLHWDAINPITGTPFTWDDPNLFYNEEGIGMYREAHDEGFVPYANPLPTPHGHKQPKKKPFHRRAPKPGPITPANDPNHPPNPTVPPMSTFKYTINPKSGGGFRAQAVLGDQIDEAAFTAMIATAASVTPAQAEAVIKAFLAKLRECAAGCAWSRSLYGEISVRPTCGGSETAPDAFQNAAEINADISLSFLSSVIDTWQTTLVLESKGTKGNVTTVIDTILSAENDAENHYVAGTMIRLVGHDLRFDKTVNTQGVFFIKADNTEVRATSYGSIAPSEVIVLVPAALSGALRVRIAAEINGGLRSYTYTHSLI